MDWSQYAGLASVPVVVAMVLLATTMGLPKAWAPLGAVVLGVLWNLALDPLVPGGMYPLALQGVLAGLAAAGFYDLGKGAAGAVRR